MPITNPDYTNIDHEEMAKAIGLKVKHMPMLIGSFLGESTPILETIDSQIREEDYTGIRSSAHSIKGSAGNLRFTELSDMAREMEHAATAEDSSFEYKAYLDAMKAAIETISI
jgi:HPt (histidine-containing phosphotransfer) domain-containing protein